MPTCSIVVAQTSGRSHLGARPCASNQKSLGEGSTPAQTFDPSFLQTCRFDAWAIRIAEAWSIGISLRVNPHADASKITNRLNRSNKSFSALVFPPFSFFICSILSSGGKLIPASHQTTSILILTALVSTSLSS